jgi:uncharacterized membrane protein
LVIFLIGFAMHLPVVTWQDGKVEVANSLMKWLCTVDILPCLAVSLAVLLVAARACRGALGFDVVCAALAVVVVGGAPLATSWTSASPGMTVLLSWCNPQQGALFPLLPWLAFAAAGALCSRWQGRVPAFLVAAGICWLATRVLPAFPEIPSLARPDFFLERLSWVLLLGALVAWWPGLARNPLLAFVGRASLLFYVLHLEILYAVLLPLPFFASLPRSACIGLAFVITLGGSLLLVYAWHTFKAARQRASGRAERPRQIPSENSLEN